MFTYVRLQMPIYVNNSSMLLQSYICASKQTEKSKNIETHISEGIFNPKKKVSFKSLYLATTLWMFHSHSSHWMFILRQSFNPSNYSYSIKVKRFSSQASQKTSRFYRLLFLNQFSKTGSPACAVHFPKTVNMWANGFTTLMTFDLELLLWPSRVQSTQFKNNSSDMRSLANAKSP